MVGGGRFSAAFATVEAYDPKTNTWTTKAPMPTPRVALAVGVVDGILYAVGGDLHGLSGNAPLASVEAYDPKTDMWTTKTPMPTPRKAMAAGVVDGILYVVGGVANSGRGTNVLEAYDPNTNTWSTKAPMPTPRWYLSAGVVDDILYAVGGVNDSGFLTTVEAYDPKTDTWSTKAPMPTARWALAAGVVDDTLYAVGGSNFVQLLAVNEAFSPFLPVSIDLKPGERANTINLKSRGIVQVAILSSPSFDASTVNPDTITLAGASVTTTGKGTPITAVRDVDRDGRLDLVVQVRTEDLQLAPTDTEAVLKATTFSGQRIRGVDSVRIVP